MFYPEDEFVDSWNTFITIILIFTSLSAPVKVAFITEETVSWIIVNFVVDFSFFIDIIITFNSAVINAEIIDDRKIISCLYLSGWFWIDLLSIIPFDIIAHQANNNMNNMVKIIRISRMYKLVKLTRLLKMAKIIKDRSKILKVVNETLKVTTGFERLFFYL